MLSRSLAAVASLAFVVLAAVAPGRASGASSPTAVTVVGPIRPPAGIGIGQLSRLPASHLSTSFLTEHGVHRASFDGPLLWAVLAKAGAIDPGKPRDQVSQFIVITGRDGYRAVLALAEIAPAFEDKPVILADRMDGTPLGAEHLRVVVPLDKRGGRSVRDVVRIQVFAASP